MQHNPREIVLQFTHVLQEDLFPHVQKSLGPLSPQMQLLTAVSAMIPLGRLLSARRAAVGRPAKDRAALATAFIAKAIWNLPTTRDLIDRLRVDEALRRLCGWRSLGALPHESKFSRAFAEFARSELPQQLHEAIVAGTQEQRLVGHIARDATAIPARERYPETERQRAQKVLRNGQKKQPKPNQKKLIRAKASKRGTRIQRQRHQTLEEMLAELPRECNTGGKKNSKGHDQCWRGYKLHLDVADGQLPISAILTSASLHDSQVAIPLMHMTSKRVVYLYDLMDSGYDADGILAESRKLNHVPIVVPSGRRGTKRESQCPKAYPPKPTPQLSSAEQDRYKERTMIERVNARLKDEFGASQLRVRGSAKVMAHLMFGVLALTVDQWLRLAGSS